MTSSSASAAEKSSDIDRIAHTPLATAFLTCQDRRLLLMPSHPNSQSHQSVLIASIKSLQPLLFSTLESTLDKHLLLSTVHSTRSSSIRPRPSNSTWTTTAFKMGCASSTGLDVSHEEVVAHQAIEQQIIKDKEATKYAGPCLSKIFGGGADCLCSLLGMLWECYCWELEKVGKAQ